MSDTVRCCYGFGVIILIVVLLFFFFFSSRRRHTRFDCDWSSDVCSSDLDALEVAPHEHGVRQLAERPERKRVAHGVAHEGAAGAVGLELMRVVPELVRSEERRVGKECRCRWSP